MKQYAGWKGLFPKSIGLLEEVEGVEQALNVKGVIDVFISKGVGGQLKYPKNNTALCGFIWAHASTREKLEAILQEANSFINFKVQ